MEHKIGEVVQEFAIDENLSITKVYVLTWVHDCFNDNSSFVKTFSDDCGVDLEYTWVKYDTFIEEYPILNITKKTLGKIMLELSKLGIIKKHTDRTPHGAFTYYAKGDKWSGCFEKINYSIAYNETRN